MDALTWLPTALSVVLFLGASAVYLRGSRDKGTIATLEKNNDALDERVRILEASDAAKDFQIDALAKANAVLTNTVNSSDLIIALQTDLGEHHDAAMTNLEQIHADLSGLPSQLADAMRGKE